MFLIPHLLLEYLMILKLIIPQMCPNFVRMVNGLITLSREQRFIVMDLLRLCVLKANLKHDHQCFYLSKSPGKEVIEKIPGKDTAKR